ncbi:hypothetical protein [Salinivirga cyanobacteriivorans]
MWVQYKMRLRFTSWLVLVFIIFAGTPSNAAHIAIDSTESSDEIDSLKKVYQQIEYEGPYTTSFYTALSAYPELKNTAIHFKHRNIKTTMQCRPKIFSVFRKPDKREFMMVFNRNQGKSRGVPIGELSFNARVGLFAHEIAHVVDYVKMSSGQTIGQGFKYLTRRGKIALEHKIDRMVIWKGFGHQIYQYAHEVLSSQSITDDYRLRRKRIYLQPAEIKALVDIVENPSLNVNR